FYRNMLGRWLINFLCSVGAFAAYLVVGLARCMLTITTIRLENTFERYPKVRSFSHLAIQVPLVRTEYNYSNMFLQLRLENLYPSFSPPLSITSTIVLLLFIAALSLSRF